MAMYSMIQFGAVILTYFVGSVLGNWQYLYEDLALVFPLTILMGSTRANRSLTIKRPSGNLLSVQNLSNLCVHILLSVGFQVLLYETIIHESDYVKLDNPDFTAYSYVTTCLYYFSNFQYTFIAVLFALGRPWKRSLLTNWKFCLWSFISFGFSVALLYSPLMEPGFFREDDLVIPTSWKRTIGLYALGYLGSTILWELILSPLFMKVWKKLIKTGEMKGWVFGREKCIEGKKSKPYHRIRGEFERGWKVKEQ